MWCSLLVDAEENIADLFEKLDNAAALLRFADAQAAVGRYDHIFLTAYQNRTAFLTGGNDITSSKTASADRDLGYTGTQYIDRSGAFGKLPLWSTGMRGAGCHHCCNR